MRSLDDLKDESIRLKKEAASKTRALARLDEAHKESVNNSKVHGDLENLSYFATQVADTQDWELVAKRFIIFHFITIQFGSKIFVISQ